MPYFFASPNGLQYRDNYELAQIFRDYQQTKPDMPTCWGWAVCMPCGVCNILLSRLGLRLRSAKLLMRWYFEYHQPGPCCITSNSDSIAIVLVFMGVGCGNIPERLLMAYIVPMWEEGERVEDIWPPAPAKVLRVALLSRFIAGFGCCPIAGVTFVPTLFRWFAWFGKGCCWLCGGCGFWHGCRLLPTMP